MSIERMLDITDYIKICGYVDGEVIYRKFFMTPEGNEETVKRRYRRYMQNLVTKRVVQSCTLPGAIRTSKLYSLARISKSISGLKLMQFRLESRTLHYFECIGYTLKSLRRNFKLDGTVALPCVTWFQKDGRDIFVSIEIARTQDELDEILDKYEYIRNSKLYTKAFDALPLVAIKTNLKIWNAKFSIMRIPYDKEW